MKKYPGGVMTTHIHEMKVVESLAIKGPILKFAYKPNEFDVRPPPPCHAFESDVRVCRPLD